MRAVLLSHCAGTRLLTFAFALSALACGAKPSIRPNGSGGNGGGSDAGAAGAGFGGAGGGAGTTQELAGLKTLRIDPRSATVTIVAGMVADVPFKAFGTFADGSERDVTEKVRWSTSNSLLVPAIKGVVKPSPQVPGVFKVIAQSDLVRDEAALTVTLDVAMGDPTFMDPATAQSAGGTVLPSTPEQKFTGAVDPAQAPSLVYPNDKVLLPPNLNGVEFHFRPKATSSLFEVSFKSDSLNYRVYTRCRKLGDGCLFLPPADAWKTITYAGRTGGPLTVSVRATDDQGGSVGASNTISIGFAPQDIQGAVYYWTTSKDTAVMRWDFGNTQQKVAEQVVTPADGDGSSCVGCHALSRDGSKMVASLGGQNDGRLLLYDVPGRKRANAVPFTEHSQFESWNPDGTAFVGVYGDKNTHKNLLLFDATTLKITKEIDVMGMWADHPDWSADGRMIAFTDVGQHVTDQRSFKGQIAIIRSDGTGWSAPQVLVPREPGTNHYYPAISPNNSILVFNTSKCAKGDTGEDCDFDMDPTSKMFSVGIGTDPGAPVELAAANAPGIEDGTTVKITNSFPRWSPFITQLSEGRDLLWLTFTSKRAYGLRKSKVLVWMTAVEPARIGTKQDPSYPAFVLPFQDIESNNHIAQWTQKVPAGE